MNLYSLIIDYNQISLKITLKSVEVNFLYGAFQKLLAFYFFFNGIIREIAVLLQKNSIKKYALDYLTQ